MGREFELKFAATVQAQQALEAQYGPFRKIAMETTYFDTPDKALSAQHITLRLRRENDAMVCTLKTPLAQGGRGEWECLADTMDAGLAGLLAAGAPEAPIQLAKQGLVIVCGARFTRLAAELPTADGTAELALDHGVLIGGSKELPLCEVELEQKTGSDTATAQLAAHIAQVYGLQAESKSKFRRAMALAQEA